MSQINLIDFNNHNLPLVDLKLLKYYNEIQDNQNTAICKLSNFNELFSFICNVCYHEKYSNEISYISMVYFSKLEQRKNISKRISIYEKLNIITCISLASKYYRFKLKSNQKLKCQNISWQDICDNEQFILESLDWDLCSVTPNLFLQIAMDQTADLLSSHSIKKLDTLLKHSNYQKTKFLHSDFFLEIYSALGWKTMTYNINFYLIHVDYKIPWNQLAYSIFFHYVSAKCNNVKNFINDVKLMLSQILQFKDLIPNFKLLELSDEDVDTQENRLIAHDAEENKNGEPIPGYIPVAFLQQKLN